MKTLLKCKVCNENPFECHHVETNHVEPYKGANELRDELRIKELEQKLADSEATLKEAVEVIRWTNMVHDDGRRARDFLAKIEGKKD